MTRGRGENSMPFHNFELNVLEKSKRKRKRKNKYNSKKPYGKRIKKLSRITNKVHLVAWTISEQEGLKIVEDQRVIVTMIVENRDKGCI